MANMTDEQKKVMAQMEDLLILTFNTMKKACSEKCSKPSYDLAELVKSEAVCMDRCVAKYMELHEMIGKRLSRDKETYDMLAKPAYETDIEKTQAYKLKKEVDDQLR